VELLRTIDFRPSFNFTTRERQIIVYRLRRLRYSLLLGNSYSVFRKRRCQQLKIARGSRDVPI